MSVKLTQKKRKLILAQLDGVILHHRLQIYQQLSARIDSTSPEQIRGLIGQMHDQLLDEIIPLFDDLLTGEVLSLPFETTHKAV